MIHLNTKKLNLGCGQDLRAGYVNVDLHDCFNPDVLADILDLKDFPSRYYEEIAALGVLEHFKRIHTRKALYEWNRLLVPNGVLELSTTYLNGLARKLEALPLQSIPAQERVVHVLFAEQDFEGNYHLTAFSETLIRYYLWECGFAIEDLSLRDGWLFEIRARKETDYSFVELVSGASEDAVFLRNAYQAILFREPDAVELTQYGPAARQGRVARQRVISELLSTDERKKRMIARAPEFKCVLNARMGLCGEQEVSMPEPQEAREPTVRGGIFGSLPQVTRLFTKLAGKGKSAFGRLKRRTLLSGRSFNS